MQHVWKAKHGLLPFDQRKYWGPSQESLSITTCQLQVSLPGDIIIKCCFVLQLFSNFSPNFFPSSAVGWSCTYTVGEVHLCHLRCTLQPVWDCIGKKILRFLVILTNTEKVCSQWNDLLMHISKNSQKYFSQKLWNKRIKTYKGSCVEPGV